MARRMKDRKLKAKLHALNGSIKMKRITAAVQKKVRADQDFEQTDNNGRRVLVNNISAVDTFGQTEFVPVKPKLKLSEGEQRAIDSGELELDDILFQREKSAKRGKVPVIVAITSHAKIYGNGRLEFIRPHQAVRAPLKPFEALPIGTNGNPALGAFAASHKGFWDKPEKQETAESRRIRSITLSNKLNPKQKGEKLRLLIEGSSVSHTKGSKIRVSPSEVQKDHGER